MAKRTVDIYLRAHDEASRKLKQVDDHTKRLADSARRMGTAFMVAGTAMAAGLGLMMRGTMKQILMLHKLRDITGLTAVELQRFGFAAEQQHGSLEAIAKIFPKLSKFMGEAKDGMATYLDEFNKMGVAVVDAEGKLRNVQDVFMDMADFMAKEGVSATEKNAVALTLMGRSAMELMSFMMLGSKGIKALLKEAERFNFISDDMVTRGKAVDDVMTNVRYSMRTLKTTIGTSMVPAFESLAKTLDKAAKWFDKLPEGVRNLIGPMMALGAVVLIAGGAFMRFIVPMMLLKALTPGIAGFSAVLTTSMIPAIAKLGVVAKATIVPLIGYIAVIEGVIRGTALLVAGMAKLAELTSRDFPEARKESEALRKEMMEWVKYKGMVGGKAFDQLTGGEGLGKAFAGEMDAAMNQAEKSMNAAFDKMSKMTSDAKGQLGELGQTLKEETIGLDKFIPAMMEMGKGLKGIFEVGQLVPPADMDQRRPVQIQVNVYSDDSKAVGKILESELDKAGAFA